MTIVNMANYGVEEEREKQDVIREIGKKAFDMKQKKWGDKVKRRKEELAKKIESPKALEKAEGGKKDGLKVGILSRGIAKRNEEGIKSGWGSGSTEHKAYLKRLDERTKRPFTK